MQLQVQLGLMVSQLLLDQTMKVRIPGPQSDMNRGE